MSGLNEHSFKTEDCLRLTFDGAYDASSPRERELEPLLQVLESHAGEWMPDVVTGRRQRRYSRDAFWKALGEGDGERYSHCGLSLAKWPAMDMSLGLCLDPLQPRMDLQLKVAPLSFFSEEEQCRRFVEMVRAWAVRYPVAYAAAHSMADDQLSGAPNFGRDDEMESRDGFDKVYEVFWLNVFGPALVESIGRERVLSTPAHRVEALPNGAVLVVTWPTLADFASEQARLAQARALVHLRPNLSLDTVLSRLRERSSRLAPVAPHFHPDVALLLARVVERAPSHLRQRRIAELNAWQPPEPGEWCPVECALPSDVDAPDVAREHYATLAEHLVALLHTQVPSVFDTTPESLTDIDFHFWREDFPTRYPREVIEAYAIPGVGAYLGEVLVRHLGGEWLPRRQLSEVQVRVGRRVWFPFRLARHYLATRQSLLDHSLTRLFLVAGRHRE